MSTGTSYVLAPTLFVGADNNQDRTKEHVAQTSWQSSTLLLVPYYYFMLFSQSHHASSPILSLKADCCNLNVVDSTNIFTLRAAFSVDCQNVCCSFGPCVYLQMTKNILTPLFTRINTYLLFSTFNNRWTTQRTAHRRKWLMMRTFHKSVIDVIYLCIILYRGCCKEKVGYHRYSSTLKFCLYEYQGSCNNAVRCCGWCCRNSCMQGTIYDDHLLLHFSLATVLLLLLER